MEAFFHKTFQSYDDFYKQFIEWQDNNFQYITVNKSDKLSTKMYSEATILQFKYEKIRFHCHHSKSTIKISITIHNKLLLLNRS